MTALTFTKRHGLGNDFLCSVDPPVEVTSSLAAALADRRRGVGADGVIVARPDGDDGGWAMTLWNADGSRAEISGNGIRCIGHAILDHQQRSAPAELAIRTDAGLRHLVLAPGEEPSTVLVRVSMGPAKLGPDPSPVLAEHGFDGADRVAVDLGNPHLVVRVEDPWRHDLAVLGPAIQAGYPEGVNVHLVTVPGRDRVVLRVWERGAGLTEACGSGACAAAWAAHRWGLIDEVATVEMPGGAVTVEVGDPMVLTGPATRVATVVVDV